MREEIDRSRQHLGRYSTNNVSAAANCCSFPSLSLIPSLSDLGHILSPVRRPPLLLLLRTEGSLGSPREGRCAHPRRCGWLADRPRASEEERRGARQPLPLGLVSRTRCTSENRREPPMEGSKEDGTMGLAIDERTTDLSSGRKTTARRMLPLMERTKNLY